MGKLFRPYNILQKTYFPLQNISNFSTSLTKVSVTEKYVAFVILCKCNVFSSAPIQGKMFCNINGTDGKNKQTKNIVQI